MTNSELGKSNNTKLTSWCEAQIEALQLGRLQNMQSLSGDASFRQYYRIELDHGSLIAVSAPPEKEKNNEFLAISKQLEAAAIPASQVLAHNLQQGFLLQNDLGDTLLLDVLARDNVEHWYSEAIELLLRFQTLGPLQDVPRYDRARIVEDLQRFPEWYVAGLLEYTPSKAERQLFDQFSQQLASVMAEQTQALSHYDFQSRNLMVHNNKLALIDYQDACLAPITYDLASLLRDCYVSWPDDRVASWVQNYLRLAKASGLIAEQLSEQEFKRWFDFTGLQRHVRVLGTFARLSLRDNKHGYLKDLPLVQRYVKKVSAEHDSLSSFADWLSTSLLPIATEKKW